MGRGWKVVKTWQNWTGKKLYQNILINWDVSVGAGSGTAAHYVRRDGTGETGNLFDHHSQRILPETLYLSG